MHVLASRIGNELYGWPKAFLRELIPVLANGYKLCGWLVAFLRTLVVCAGK